jgi:hypothetical protein
MTQLGSILSALVLALTAYFAVAAWHATADDRRDAGLVMRWEPPAAPTQSVAVSYLIVLWGLLQG